MTITLKDSAGNVVGTTMTSTGPYVFNNVMPGTYTLLESQPAKYVDGIETAGSLLAGTRAGTTTRSPPSPWLGADRHGVQLRRAAGDVRLLRPHGDHRVLAEQERAEPDQELQRRVDRQGAGGLVVGHVPEPVRRRVGQLAGRQDQRGRGDAVHAAVQRERAEAGRAGAGGGAGSLLDDQHAGRDGRGQVRVHGGRDRHRAPAVQHRHQRGGVRGEQQHDMEVLDILAATNARAVNGVLYNGNTGMRNMANNVFSGINQQGDILLNYFD